MNDMDKPVVTGRINVEMINGIPVATREGGDIIAMTDEFLAECDPDYIRRDGNLIAIGHTLCCFLNALMV